MEEIKPSTYLAGPINVSKMTECKDWRNFITEALNKLDIETFNPLGNGGGDRISQDLRQKLHNANKLGDIDVIRQIVGNIIIPPDLIMLEKCDFLTLWLPIDDGYEICGSYGEVTLSHYLHKPIYVVTERRIFPCEIPNWLIGCSTQIFTSWKDYMNFIRKEWVTPLAIKELEIKLKPKDWLSKLKDEHK